MKFTVRTLTLHLDIVIPEQAGKDGTIRLYEYRSLVKTKDLEPPPEHHLADGKPMSAIPAGLYLFTQGELENEQAAADSSEPTLDSQQSAMPSAAAEARFREAAEAVWLEALWREISLKNEKILVRILSEDTKYIFQIFREV